VAIAFHADFRDEERMAGPAQDRIKQFAAHVGSVFLGKADVLQLVMVTLLAEGHLLIEDVPGVGKTLLAKTLAKSLACTFHRVQFTPDLLPSDLTGVSVYHQPSGEFVFKPGPIFANIVLADEINRATPRTQSALLEAMSDQQVSVDGRTLPIEAPFMVVATQNPFEFEGTYPLPENQLDRFMMRLRLGYPTREVEKAILFQHREGEVVEKLTATLDRTEVLELQAKVRQVKMDDSLSNYLLSLVEATRQRADVYLGVSTRGALMLYRGAQALALVEGRDYVIPDDIKRLAVAILGHRLVPKAIRQTGTSDAGDQIVQDILNTVAVPT
jgi:MoxR-like ATPase